MCDALSLSLLIINYFLSSLCKRITSMKIDKNNKNQKKNAKKTQTQTHR